MEQPLDYIYSNIAMLNPMHSKKLKKNRAFFDAYYYQLADAFFKKYTTILQQKGKTIDYAIDCYLQMIADVNSETVEFLRSGKYTSTTFEEVNQRVYGTPGVMEYYMHGLILSQFLWKHHYQMLAYFISAFPAYAANVKSYLEVGAGHGLYLSKATESLNNDALVTVVDISETSIALARDFADDSRITFNLKNIFDFGSEDKYNFITLGEVLEHVEDPLSLLQKLHSLLSDGGTLFFTTPTNAPAIDHIYLFNNVDEIREIVTSAGFSIESELALLTEDISPERAEKYKIAVLYGAFLKKIK